MARGPPRLARVTTTLYRRGRVRSPADPFATALLVDGDTVAWVGSEGAADALGADVTVDLDDAWVAPAFVDAHVHTTTTGLALTGLDLADAPSLAVLLDRPPSHQLLFVTGHTHEAKLDTQPGVTIVNGGSIGGGGTGTAKL